MTCIECNAIGTMLEISTGIEPNFAFSFVRKTESLHGEDVYYSVFTKIAKEYMKENNIDKEEDLPDYFVTAQNLHPGDRVKMQGIWQEAIDASISSTVNIVNETTVDVVSDLYMMAYDNGLKGMTIYRAGCAREGILVVNTNKDQKEDNIAKEEKDIELARGVMEKVPFDTIYIPKEMNHGCGKAKVMIGFSPSRNKCTDIYYINKGKGGCSKNTQGEAILISQILRTGGNLEDIKKSFAGIDACSSCTMSRMKGKKVDGINCPNILLNLVIDTQKELQDSNILLINNNPVLYSKNEINTNDYIKKILCPECGSELEVSGGCYSCRNCGFSKCE